MKQFFKNIGAELDEQGRAYGRAFGRAVALGIAFAFLKDLDVFPALSWWWIALPAARIIALGLCLTWVGFGGTLRDE
jgi:hypothetical protein